MSEIITKTELAEMLGISKARVSQLIGKGLPVETDKSLNLTRVKDWLNNYTKIDLSNLKPPAKPLPAHFAFVENLSDDADRSACIGAMQLAYRIPGVVGALANSMGLPMRDIYVLHQLMMTAAVEEATNILTKMGCEPFASDPQAPVWHPEIVNRIDWKATARARSVACDLPAWEAALMKFQKDIEGAP